MFKRVHRERSSLAGTIRIGHCRRRSLIHADVTRMQLMYDRVCADTIHAVVNSPFDRGQFEERTLDEVSARLPAPAEFFRKIGDRAVIGCANRDSRPAAEALNRADIGPYGAAPICGIERRLTVCAASQLRQIIAPAMTIRSLSGGKGTELKDAALSCLTSKRLACGAFRLGSR